MSRENIRIKFPYEGYSPVEVPKENLLGIFTLPKKAQLRTEDEILKEALANPIGCSSLLSMLSDKKKVLIVSDDHHRPTPVQRILPFLMEQLRAAGFGKDSVEIIMALGTHRPMSEQEMRIKLGDQIVDEFPVSNHDWKNPKNQYFAGKVPPGIEVWVNRKLREFDFILGLGSIIPIDVCGFTGGGKIIIPGLCGEKTNSDLHWVRVDIPQEELIGLRDNSIRHAIDNSALAAGLDAIFNVVMDGEGKIVQAVFGHPVEAHRVGVRYSLEAHSVVIPQRADIIIADGYPFDIEFWQVNKALDNAALAVKDGGVIIIVSPCREGLSRAHEREILKFGYRPTHKIKQLVAEGKIKHRVVAVHMIQVARATIDRKITFILVTDGISPEIIKKVNLDYASEPQSALNSAFRKLGKSAKIIILQRAAEMLPLIKKQ